MTLAEAHQIITRLGDVVAFLQQGHDAVERTEATRSALARQCQELEQQKATLVREVAEVRTRAASATQQAEAAEGRLARVRAELADFLRGQLAKVE